MELSRSARITILLVIDVIFFFVELVVGYVVGSLALVADSFHMLNDVMSLIVALWAVKVAGRRSRDARYSYGWQRAEILSALVNGVFLLALCFSITMEAIERFFSKPDVSNPKLVVIVGCLGLASNVVGLFLFHGKLYIAHHCSHHGHGHEHEHEHDRDHGASLPLEMTRVVIADPSQIERGEADIARDSSVRRRSREDSYPGAYGHPAATRASIVQAAQDMTSIHTSSSIRRSGEHDSHSHTHGHRSQGALSSAGHDAELTGHNHGHGHSHGSMNMHALVLHVMGDALGNVGVIISGLVIWLTPWPSRFYLDPAVSLLITVIIFVSAVPLVRGASGVLLQGVPSDISLEDVRRDILTIDGVLSVHELHIWQLSEAKVVASVHVLASRSHEFMPVAAAIRKALHLHGIHSSTIQPEYLPDTGAAEEVQTVSDDLSCLIVCPTDQKCDPSENACCRKCTLMLLSPVTDILSR
ncbi:cation efflux protein [Coniophora puteana RWD-64-598 SS2]|uniref:Cation efflux protein n=1 Tax=Coniophora puteana (strain RWD-64-598) TaxID=741705 RepID=A0A5M3N5Q4_CONPW|nr:cation efflux protein [Coniophora puteana RWD-64-598 SS2]EIW86646.1 cation efflux protein [Coniophora puteana RWD-64-598 SS2]